jgi:predicted membrane protein
MEPRIAQPFNAGVATKIIIGLFFVALGVLLAADNLDLIHSHHYLLWWPSVLLLIGLVQLTAGSRFFGVILTIVGASFLATNLGLVRVNVFDVFWPFVMIAAGGVLVARAVGYRWQPELTQKGRTIFAILSGPAVSVNAKDFSGLNVIAFMGGAEIDLRQAEIAKSPAVIDCVAIWGGIEIIVPPQWEIIGEVVPFMGGFEITTAPAANRDKQLIIRGLAWMGGIEVRGKTA